MIIIEFTTPKTYTPEKPAKQPGLVELSSPEAIPDALQSEGHRPGEKLSPLNLAAYIRTWLGQYLRSNHKN